MNQKPQPLYPLPNRKLCPICGNVSYSAAGIHPQCAVVQADAKRMKKVKPALDAPQKPATTMDMHPWQKICPKCHAFMHTGKNFCDCGHRFAETGSR